MRQEATVVLSRIQRSKGLPGAGEGILGEGEGRALGCSFPNHPDKAGPEKFRRGYRGNGVKWSQHGAGEKKNRRKKGVRKRVQGQEEEGAELSSVGRRLSLGTFKNLDCGKQ